LPLACHAKPEPTLAADMLVPMKTKAESLAIDPRAPNTADRHAGKQVVDLAVQNPSQEIDSVLTTVARDGRVGNVVESDFTCQSIALPPRTVQPRMSDVVDMPKATHSVTQDCSSPASGATPRLTLFMPAQPAGVREASEVDSEVSTSPSTPRLTCFVPSVKPGASSPTTTPRLREFMPEPTAKDAVVMMARPPGASASVPIAKHEPNTLAHNTESTPRLRQFVPSRKGDSCAPCWSDDPTQLRTSRLAQFMPVANPSRDGPPAAYGTSMSDQQKLAQFTSVGAAESPSDLLQFIPADVAEGSRQLIQFMPVNVSGGTQELAEFIPFVRVGNDSEAYA